MEEAKVQRLSRVLKILVWIALVCNLIALLFVPELVMVLKDGGPSKLRGFMMELTTTMTYNGGQGAFFNLMVLLGCYYVVWQSVESALWTVFFWVCGACTAVILVQALNILKTIGQGEPFRMDNARSMKRAAVSCWVISAAALVRLLIWLYMEGTLAPLFTYTCLFIPVFFMVGLLFMVMSALFRQAALLQEDQDLTI